MKFNVTQQAYFDLLFDLLRFRKSYAYFWWIVGAAFGLHRMYLRDYRTAVILAAITIFTCGLGAIAGLYDITNIERRVNARNKELTLLITKEVKKV